MPARSWEADYVRRIVYSTAGEDDQRLWQYRMEPIVMRLDPEDVFDDFGLTELRVADEQAAEVALIDAETSGDPERIERAEQVLAAVEQLYEQDLPRITPVTSRPCAPS